MTTDIKIVTLSVEYKYVFEKTKQQQTIVWINLSKEVITYII